MLQIHICEAVKLSSESAFEFSSRLLRAFTHHQKPSYHVSNQEKFHWFLDATIYHMGGKAIEIANDESYTGLEFYVVHNVLTWQEEWDSQAHPVTITQKTLILATRLCGKGCHFVDVLGPKLPIIFLSHGKRPPVSEDYSSTHVQITPEKGKKRRKYRKWCCIILYIARFELGSNNCGEKDSHVFFLCICFNCSEAQNYALVTIIFAYIGNTCPCDNLWICTRIVMYSDIYIHLSNGRATRWWI